MTFDGFHFVGRLIYAPECSLCILVIISRKVWISKQKLTLVCYSQQNVNEIFLFFIFREFINIGVHITNKKIKIHWVVKRSLIFEMKLQLPLDSFDSGESSMWAFLLFYPRFPSCFRLTCISLNPEVQKRVKPKFIVLPTLSNQPSVCISTLACVISFSFGRVYKGNFFLKKQRNHVIIFLARE